MKKFFRRRRGSIAVVLVFATMIALVTLGMLRVSMAAFASGRSTEKQYADIQTMRAICQTTCYEYVTDLMACYASRNVDADMPGITDAVIYNESIEAIQLELAPRNEAGEVVDPMVWRVQDAEVALSSLEIGHPEVQAQLLSMVAGRAHSYRLELQEDLKLDFTHPDTYLGASEARIALLPVKITVTLKVKSETVVEHLSVEGLFLYIQKDTVTPVDGDPYTRASMRITDNGMGSGVHIYRAD